MTKDMIRSIRSISYNVLNLPQQIEVQTSLRGHDPFIIEPTSYLYTASGVKLQSITGLAAVLPGHPDTIRSETVTSAYGFPITTFLVEYNGRLKSVKKK